MTFFIFLLSLLWWVSVTSYRELFPTEDKRMAVSLSSLLLFTAFYMCTLQCPDSNCLLGRLSVLTSYLSTNQITGLINNFQSNQSKVTHIQIQPIRESSRWLQILVLTTQRELRRAPKELRILRDLKRAPHFGALKELRFSTNLLHTPLLKTVSSQHTQKINTASKDLHNLLFRGNRFFQ